MMSRAKMVADTAAMMVLPTCGLVNPKSARMAGMRGAIPNHPKKQTKKVIHVMWKVRIWMPPKLKMLS
jgi:hypothetical protein